MNELQFCVIFYAEVWMIEQELDNYIDFWNTELRDNNDHLFELAFFKVFVKFEKYLSDMFIYYAIGGENNANYAPRRILEFRDMNHLQVFLKPSSTSFINYQEKIPHLSKYIFLEGEDPFDLIFRDASIRQYYEKMRVLRNYIAHESDESKQKYHEKVLGSQRAFISANDYLKEINRRSSNTYYSEYMENIQEMVRRLEHPEQYS